MIVCSQVKLAERRGGGPCADACGVGVGRPPQLVHEGRGGGQQAVQRILQGEGGHAVVLEQDVHQVLCHMEWALSFSC